MAEQTRTFPRLSGSLRAARQFVAETLTQGGRAELVEDACTLVTELAANAVVHAHSGFTVSICERADGTVRVAVLDSSTVPPRLRQPERTSGRGLVLVAALARRWGHEIAAEGKTVWADLPGPGGRAG
jgi:anti-sigma regulatory factor (Ser/Thr protein kinase)